MSDLIKFLESRPSINLKSLVGECNLDEKQYIQLHKFVKGTVKKEPDFLPLIEEKLKDYGYKIGIERRNNNRLISYALSYFEEIIQDGKISQSMIDEIENWNNQAREILGEI